MSEIKLDAEELEEAGAALGFMFAALLEDFKPEWTLTTLCRKKPRSERLGKRKRSRNVRENGNCGLQEMLVRSMRAAGRVR